jgi:hypothetical protein
VEDLLDVVLELVEDPEGVVLWVRTLGVDLVGLEP